MLTMLTIGELSKQSKVARQTIRYYEQVGVLPEPERAKNGYRLYDQGDVDRLAFVRSARALEFSPDDIGEILAFRDRNEAPCSYVAELIPEKLSEIDVQITKLRRLQLELQRLSAKAANLDHESIAAKDCICHLIEGQKASDGTSGAGG